MNHKEEVLCWARPLMDKLRAFATAKNSQEADQSLEELVETLDDIKEWVQHQRKKIMFD